MIYLVTAITDRSESVQFRLDISGADPETRITEILKPKKCTPTEIKPDYLEFFKNLFFSTQLSDSEISSVFYSIYDEVTVGNKIVDAIESIIKTKAPKRTQKVCSEIIEAIQKGSSIDEAFSRTMAFPPLIPTMIKMGTESNTIPDISKTLADRYKKRKRLKGKFWKALILPGITMLAAVVVVIIASTQLLPTLLSTLPPGGSLPLPTQILMGITNVATTYGGSALILLVGGILFIAKTKEHFLKKQIQLLSYKIPVFGKILKQGDLAEFLECMAILKKSGKETGPSLSILQESMQGTVLGEKIQVIEEGMAMGMNLADGMLGDSFFSEKIAYSIYKAEANGRLDVVLPRIAENEIYKYEETLDTLGELMTPILTVFTLVVAGFVVFACMLPMYQSFTNSNFK